MMAAIRRQANRPTPKKTKRVASGTRLSSSMHSCDRPPAELIRRSGLRVGPAFTMQRFSSPTPAFEPLAEKLHLLQTEERLIADEKKTANRRRLWRERRRWRRAKPIAFAARDGVEDAARVRPCRARDGSRHIPVADVTIFDPISVKQGLRHPFGERRILGVQGVERAGRSKRVGRRAIELARERQTVTTQISWRGRGADRALSAASAAAASCP